MSDFRSGYEDYEHFILNIDTHGTLFIIRSAMDIYLWRVSFALVYVSVTCNQILELTSANTAVRPAADLFSYRFKNIGRWLRLKLELLLEIELLYSFTSVCFRKSVNQK